MDVIAGHDAFQNVDGEPVASLADDLPHHAAQHRMQYSVAQVT